MHATWRIRHERSFWAGRAAVLRRCKQDRYGSSTALVLFKRDFRFCLVNGHHQPDRPYPKSANAGRSGDVTHTAAQQDHRHLPRCRFRRYHATRSARSSKGGGAGTRHRPQRRMSPVWESYCATRSWSSLHTEAPTESLRERPDQSEARQVSVGVLQIEAEPLVLHTELV
jgi:hypothetical protein